MILEIAQIAVKLGMEDQFEAAVAEAKPLFQRAKGCLSMDLVRSIEYPSRYRLLVGWETLEDHTVDFRNSDDFQTWRGLVSQCFDGAPEVGHAAQAVTGF
jgi:heme-degrading monooxygenase HmoA